MLKEALDYLSKGFSIIPLKPRSKEPLLSWTEFQKRRPNVEEVNGWFQKWPNANVGIVTGTISGLIVVDLDGPEGIKSGASLNLKSSCVTLTGRGKHLWYRYTNGVGNAVRCHPGIDIRAEGGYVVAPPSVHENGVRYRWLGNVSNATQLSIFPTEKFVAVALPIKKSNESGWISKALEEMTNGNIDDTLFKICSRLRNDGYTKQDASGLLEPHARRVGASPGHLDDKINNVWGRYEPKLPSIVARIASGVQLHLHSPDNADSQHQYAQLQVATEFSGSGLSTGYAKFDAISKGLKRGEVLTIAARTGVGKTNFVITPIRTFCEAGKKVLLFSTEMSFDQIWGRYIAALPNPDEFRHHQFHICDEFTPSIERIEEAIRSVQPDLFIFDHISHIGTDYHIISAFMSEIKRLCRLFNLPAIVTAQLNRNADWVEQGERVEPRLSMIQGSDQIGQMSAQVLLLNEKRVNPDYAEIDGIIVKNRHGDKGLIKFALKKNPYRIEEL